MHSVAVNEIMTKDPLTCESNLPIDVALETMTANNIRRLPVVTKSGHVSGIITRFDCLLALKKETSWFSSSGDEVPSVKDTMTANVITISPGDSVGRTAQLMLSHKIGALPVLDDSGKLIGIVTESDLFRYIASQFEDEE